MPSEFTLTIILFFLLLGLVSFPILIGSNASTSSGSSGSPCPACALKWAHNDFNVDQNITSFNANAALRLDNRGGGPDGILMNNGVLAVTITSPLAGYYGYLLDAGGVPAGWFEGYDFSNFRVLGPAGVGSQWTDADGINLNGTTVVNGDLIASNNFDNSGGFATLNDIFIGGTLQSNINLDANFVRSIGNSNGYLQNVYTQTIYVDQNIYADTYDTNNVKISLNTCYTNNSARDLVFYGSVNASTTLALDTAYAEIQAGIGCGSLATKQKVGTSTVAAVNESGFYTFAILVPKKSSYRIKVTTSGSGSLKLEYVQEYYP